MNFLRKVMDATFYMRMGMLLLMRLRGEIGWLDHLAYVAIWILIYGFVLFVFETVVATWKKERVR